LLIGACAWEWARLSGLSRIPAAVYAGSLGGLTALAAQATGRAEAWYMAAALFWGVMAPWLLWRGPKLQSAGFRLMAGLIVLVPAGLALINIRSASPGLLLLLMAIVWISDSAAYFSGRAFGRRKLAPVVSPGKTWEGVYGALAAVLVYAIICLMVFEPLAVPRWFPGNLGLPLAAMLWLFLAAAGIIGDLMESLLKRAAGVKDSGNMLPGHGGILDRVDALLPILPIAALFYLR
jgi:phosphatidate cytidylyltransferase